MIREIPEQDSDLLACGAVTSRPWFDPAEILRHACGSTRHRKQVRIVDPFESALLDYLRDQKGSTTKEVSAVFSWWRSAIVIRNRLKELEELGWVGRVNLRGAWAYVETADAARRCIHCRWLEEHEPARRRIEDLDERAPIAQ